MSDHCHRLKKEIASLIVVKRSPQYFFKPVGDVYGAMITEINDVIVFDGRNWREVKEEDLRNVYRRLKKHSITIK